MPENHNPTLPDQSDSSYSPQLMEFVEGLGQVEILSSSSMALLRELSAGDLSSKQVGVKISQDPTLSASVLKLANSAYYGIPNKVSTVNHAVSLLGFTAVRNLVQGLCLIDFDHPEIGLNDSNGGREFGAHSMAVSKMAGILTKKFGFATLGQGEAETAGLLHDMGLLLMAAGKKTQFEQFVTAYKNQSGPVDARIQGETPILKLEQDFFGFTHPELGVWLGERWNLPSVIREALHFHHAKISDCYNRESVAVIQMANLICNENEMHYIPGGFWGDIDPSTLQFLASQNKMELYESLPHSIEKEIEEVKQLYDFICSGMKAAPTPPPVKRPVVKEKEAVVKKSTAKKPPSQAALFIPGLPQILEGNQVLGWIFCLVFLASLVGCAVGLATGHAGLGIGSLLLAAGSWIGSIVTT